MAIDDNARALADGCVRIKRDSLEPSDYEGIKDELGLDDSEWQRLRWLLDRSRSQPDDEVLLENWHTVKNEIIGGRIYGLVRANFPELSHELLGCACIADEPPVGKVSLADENILAELPFAFSSNLTDEILLRLRLASDKEVLRREIRKAVKRERSRRQIIRIIIRPVIRVLAFIGIILLVVALWKLLRLVL